MVKCTSHTLWSGFYHEVFLLLDKRHQLVMGIGELGNISVMCVSGVDYRRGLMRITSSGLVLKGCDVDSQTKWHSIGRSFTGQRPTVKGRQFGGPLSS